MKKSNKRYLTINKTLCTFPRMEGTHLEGYYSVREAALKAGCKRQWILFLIKEKRLVPVKYVDNYYLIPEKTLLNFIKEKTEKK